MKKILVLLMVLVSCSLLYATGTTQLKPADIFIASHSVPDSTGIAYNTADSVQVSVVYQDGTESLDSTWYNSGDAQASEVNGILQFFDAWDDLNGSDGVGQYTINLRWYDGTLALDFQETYIVQQTTMGLEDLNDTTQVILADLLIAIDSINATLDSLQSQDGWVAQQASLLASIDSINAILDTLQAGYASRSAIGDTNQVDLTNYDGATPLTASDNIGINWADVANPTTVVNLSSTNIDVDQVIASVSGNVDGSVASVTTVNDKTDYSLSASAYSSIRDSVSNDSTAYQGSEAGLDSATVDFIVRQVTGDSTYLQVVRAFVDSLVKADSLVDLVWDEDSTGHYTSPQMAFVASQVGSGGTLTAAEIVDSILAIVLSDTVTATYYAQLIRDVAGIWTAGSRTLTANTNLEGLAVDVTQISGSTNAADSLEDFMVGSSFIMNIGGLHAVASSGTAVTFESESGVGWEVIGTSDAATFIAGTGSAMYWESETGIVWDVYGGSGGSRIVSFDGTNRTGYVWYMDGNDSQSAFHVNAGIDQDAVVFNGNGTGLDFNAEIDSVINDWIAKESSVQDISLTGTNLTTVADTVELTDGTETNDFTATRAHDGTYYEVAEGGTGTNLNINYYLLFDIGENTKTASVTYHGRLVESAPAGQDTIDVFVFDWSDSTWTHVSPPTGDIIGKLADTPANDETYEAILPDNNYVAQEGDSVGMVKIAFSNYDPDGAASSNLKENTELKIDYVFLEYQSSLSAEDIWTYDPRGLTEPVAVDSLFDALFTVAKFDPAVFAAITDSVWDEDIRKTEHNETGSAAKFLREIGELILQSGTAQGAGIGTNQIQLSTSASAIDGTYDPSTILLVGGTGEDQMRSILEYSGSDRMATVSRDWKTNPDATTEYLIVANQGALHVNEGLAMGGSDTSIFLNTLASDTNDTYLYQVVFIVSGTGADQAGLIRDYIGSTHEAIIGNSGFNPVPDTTSAYLMLPLVDAFYFKAGIYSDTTLADSASYQAKTVGIDDSTAADVSYIANNQDDYKADVSGCSSPPSVSDDTVFVYDAADTTAIVGVTVTVRPLGGGTAIQTKTTNSSGLVIFGLLDGTYEYLLYAQGYNFNAVDTLTISGTSTDSLYGDRFAPTPPTADQVAIFTWITTAGADTIDPSFVKYRPVRYLGDNVFSNDSSKYTRDDRIAYGTGSSKVLISTNYKIVEEDSSGFNWNLYANTLLYVKGTLDTSSAYEFIGYFDDGEETWESRVIWQLSDTLTNFNPFSQ